MNTGRTVFSQLVEFLPHQQFQKCVDRYGGGRYLKNLSCWDQYLAMAFAQLTYRESLRDIEACLGSIGGKLYHMGFRGKVARSTLADANETRDWRIYADFAQVLIAIARPLYALDPIGVDLDQSLYALDSTTIDLCLALFPWAKFRKHKAAVKMHTLLDLRGNIPTFIRITEGRVHDVNILDEIMPEPAAFYVMDRAYVDFERLFFLTLSSAFFVVRTKANVLLQRRYSHKIEKSTGVRSDHTVILTSFESASVYPDALRRVTFLDVEKEKRFKFLTNNFTLPAHVATRALGSPADAELSWHHVHNAECPLAPFPRQSDSSQSPPGSRGGGHTSSRGYEARPARRGHGDSALTGTNAGDFSQTNTCGTSVGTGASCTITVTFTPTATGTRNASVTITDNAFNSPQNIAVTGTGVGAPLTVSPSTLSFGSQGISSTSGAKKVTVTNNTGAVVTISSMTISGTNAGDFAQSATTCGGSLGLNKSCTISITFTPSASGARSATFTLTDSAVNSPQTVSLSGTGVAQVTLSATTFAFGNQAVGTISTPKTVTLTNNTSTALAISSVSITGTNASEFQVSSNTCGSSVGGHTSCKISVTFAPLTTGAKTASLTITDSANNSPQSVSLTGAGVLPVSVTPSKLTFAAQKVGTTSPPKKVTVKNNLKTTLTISSITVTGANAGDFAQSATTCGTTLAAGASCTVSITFTPSAKGTRVAVLDVADNATTSPQAVSLSGTGT